MANTNWFKGIDSGLSTPGGTQVALAGYFFVDAVNGNDTTGDGSPDNPWATINKALDSGVTSSGSITGFYDYDIEKYSQRVVVASGYYNSSSNVGVKQFFEIIANVNGGVIIDCGGGQLYPQTTTLNRVTFTGVKIANGRFSRKVDQKNYRFCVFDNGNDLTETNSDNEIRVANCSFVNGSNLSIDDSTLIGTTFIKLDYCTFHNSTLEGASSLIASGELIANNCDFDDQSTIQINDDFLTFPDNDFLYCNLRATVVNLDGGSTVLPSSDPTSNINQDSLYTGAPDELELIIQTGSPLIGAGENNSTIGSFRVGELVDLSSPAENNNITVGATIDLDANNNEGNVKPAWKTFSQVRKSPIIKINGLPSSPDNIPSVNIITPLKFLIEVAYREIVGGSEITKEFIYGLPLLLDNSGNSTGEDSFDSFDISSDGDLLGNPDNLSSSNLISIAEIQENFKLINLPIHRLEGCLLWYTADNTIGDPITQVTNLNTSVNNSSISDLELPSSGGFLPPELVTNEINGKSALKFGETIPEAIRTRTLTSFPSAVTAVCLVKINELNTSNRVMFISGNSSGELRLDLDASNNFRITHTGSFVVGTSTAVLNGVYVITSVYNGVNSKIRINKVTENTGDTGFVGGANYGLGRVLANPVGQKFSAREFGLFSGDLIADEPVLLEYIEQYLMDEGGI